MAAIAFFLSRPISPNIGAPMSEASAGYSFNEAVEKRVSGGLRCGPCRCGFADHTQSLDETDENSPGTRRLDTIGQLARHLRPGKRIRHLGLHGFEKARDATADFDIPASQFHGCGHQQAAVSAVGTARAFNIAGKISPQAIDRLSGRSEL